MKTFNEWRKERQAQDERNAKGLLIFILVMTVIACLAV